MKKAILIQARLSSTRFPNKVMCELNSYSLIEYIYTRCKQTKIANQVIVITSIDSTDDPLYNLCIQKQISVFRGNLHDVLYRYIDAAEFHKIDVICRVCGDSPFVDIEAIDKMFTAFDNNQNLEYISTDTSLNGFMSEIFTLNLLKKLYNFKLTISDKEHVTKYIRNNLSQFNTEKIDLNLKNDKLEKYTLTIDFPEDLEIAKKIVKELKGFDFKSNDVVKILNRMEKYEL